MRVASAHTEKPVRTMNVSRNLIYFGLLIKWIEGHKSWEDDELQ